MKSRKILLIDIDKDISQNLSVTKQNTGRKFGVFQSSSAFTSLQRDFKVQHFCHPEPASLRTPVKDPGQFGILVPILREERGVITCKWGFLFL